MATTQGIKLDEDTQTRLKALGAKRDRSPHWLMKAAIETYLEREEQYEREKAEDMQRYEHYLLTGTAVDGDAAEAWLTALSQGKTQPWPKP